LGEIIFTAAQVDEHGTGFGNVLVVLAVQAKNSEYGSVLWNGSSDVETGDATNQSQTRTVAELTEAGIDETNLSLIFNDAEGGDADPVLTLHDFDLVFQDADGVELFRETFDSGGGLPLAGAGEGVGVSGWRFDVVFDNGGDAAAFFDTPSNRIGMAIDCEQAIEDTKGAAESFYVAGRAASGAHVPEPAALLQGLVAAGLVAGWWAKRWFGGR
jgi:hypothetical protein